MSLWGDGTKRQEMQDHIDWVEYDETLEGRIGKLLDLVEIMRHEIEMLQYDLEEMKNEVG